MSLAHRGGRDAHRVKRDAHPSLPYEHPSPPYVPVTPYEQLKFPRVINPDSPLNDSRQLDWVWQKTRLFPFFSSLAPFPYQIDDYTKNKQEQEYVLIESGSTI